MNSDEAFYQTLHDLIVSDDSFGGWGANVLAWEQRTTPTAIIKFEDLVIASNPLHLVKNALKHIGYEKISSIVSKQPPTFDELHEQMPSFFRKGKIGNWRNEMPVDLYNMFIEKHGNVLALMNYDK
jgi:hypothetical protein